MPNEEFLTAARYLNEPIASLAQHPDFSGTAIHTVFLFLELDTPALEAIQGTIRGFLKDQKS